jgi:hypothetical protein
MVIAFKHASIKMNPNDLSFLAIKIRYAFSPSNFQNVMPENFDNKKSILFNACTQKNPKKLDLTFCLFTGNFLCFFFFIFIIIFCYFKILGVEKIKLLT